MPGCVASLCVPVGPAQGRFWVLQPRGLQATALAASVCRWACLHTAPNCEGSSSSTIIVGAGSIPGPLMGIP